MYPTQAQVDKWNAWLESTGNTNSNLKLYLDEDGKLYHGNCTRTEQRERTVYDPDTGTHKEHSWGADYCDGTDDDGCISRPGSYKTEPYTATLSASNIVRSDSSMVRKPAQDICVVECAVRWYTYKVICLSLDIPQYASITINKTVYDKNGNIADVDDTFYFDILIDGSVVETVAVATKNGEGTATSTKILLENGSAKYEVKEVLDGEHYKTVGEKYTLDTSKSSGMQRNSGGRFFIYRNCLGSEYNR